MAKYTRVDILEELERLDPHLRRLLTEWGRQASGDLEISSTDASNLRRWLNQIASDERRDENARPGEIGIYAGESTPPPPIDKTRLPRHIAIIMDGNGRWAARRRLPRVAGHRAGAEAVRRTVEAAAKLEIECLTLYAFSTENWKRPRFEVRALMDLLTEYLRKELNALRKNNIRFRMVGRAEDLNLSVLEQIRRAELATFHNTGLQLCIALNYGGRTEIVDACRKLAFEAAAGRLRPGEITDKMISANLYTQALPDPDLLVRTSGEMRLSNFLLWQIAYAELHVTATLWPDFGERDLLTAIADYQKRERRFGGLDQAQHPAPPPRDLRTVSGG